MQNIKIVAGVYASQPSEEKAREEYYALLSHEYWINGAEIPFPGELAETSKRSWLAKNLPSQWNCNNITMIPGTMQKLGDNPNFGLASAQEDGRGKALEHLKSMRDALEDFIFLRGNEDVRYVQIHTAPTRQADSEAMRLSLAQIMEWNWCGAKLVIEHCDKYVPDQSSEKGFLSLEEEVLLAKEFGIGLTINWGRSAIEGRSTLTARNHIDQCAASGMLTGLMLSGAGPASTQYGYEWIDGHLPMSTLEPTSLLTPSEIHYGAKSASQSEQWLEDGYLGVKVCVPSDADIQTRLNYMKSVYEVANEAL